VVSGLKSDFISEVSLEVVTKSLFNMNSTGNPSL
jgi:hypothetical protein